MNLDKLGLLTDERRMLIFIFRIHVRVSKTPLPHMSEKMYFFKCSLLFTYLDFLSCQGLFMQSSIFFNF